MTDNSTQIGMYIGQEPDHPHYPRLEIDYELYDEYFEGSGASEEQKRAFLDTLWEIMVAFVDMGFGIYPVQQAQELAELPALHSDSAIATIPEAACEQTADKPPQTEQSMLPSDHNPTHAFNETSDADHPTQTERSQK